MNSASPDPQPSTQLFQGITNNSLRGQRHASKRPRKPKPINIMERICLSFGPALRASRRNVGILHVSVIRVTALAGYYISPMIIFVR